MREVRSCNLPYQPSLLLEFIITFLQTELQVYHELFPAMRFIGFDIDPSMIAAARSRGISFARASDDPVSDGASSARALSALTVVFTSSMSRWTAARCT